MPRVRLMHWNADEALPVRQLLSKAGFEVEYNAEYTTDLMREWRANLPSVFVIDLSRLPSHGREIAIALRQSPKTKQIPIVFCGGADEKVKQIQTILPDAAFCQVEYLIKTVKAARPLAAPLKPTDMMNRYGDRTPAQKLGITAGSKVRLVNAPTNFERVLGALPGQVEFSEDDGAVTLCFLDSVDDLVRRFRAFANQQVRPSFGCCGAKRARRTITELPNRWCALRA